MVAGVGCVEWRVASFVDSAKGGGVSGGSSREERRREGEREG